jgi:hypothetical protein
MFQANPFSLRPENNHHCAAEGVDGNEDPVRVVPDILEHDWPCLVDPERGDLLTGLGHVHTLISNMCWEYL